MSLVGRRRVDVTLAAVVAAVLFVLLALGVSTRWLPLRHADRRIDQVVHVDLVGHPGAVSALRVLTDAGSPGVSLAVLAVAVLWLAVRRRRMALAIGLVAAALGAGALERLVKFAVARPRPVFTDPLGRAAGYSFPSGHAVTSLVDYALLLFVLVPLLGRRARRLAVTGAVVWVLAVGFSRLGLGVHFLSDVIGGWLLGFAWLAACCRLWWADQRKGWTGWRTRLPRPGTSQR